MEKNQVILLKLNRFLFFTDQQFPILPSSSNYLLTSISTFFTAIPNFLISIFTAIFNFFSSIFTAISNFFTSIPNFFSSIFTPISNFFTSIPNFFSSIFTAIANFFTSIPNFFSSIFTLISNFFSSIFTPISNFFTSIPNFFSSILTIISNFFTSIPNFFSSIFTPISNFFTTFISSFFSSLFTAISNFFTSIPNFFSSIFTSISNFFISIFQHIGQFFTSIPNFFSSIFTSISNFFISIFQHIGEIPNLFTSLLHKLDEAVPPETRIRILTFISVCIAVILLLILLFRFFPLIVILTCCVVGTCFVAITSIFRCLQVTCFGYCGPAAGVLMKASGTAGAWFKGAPSKADMSHEGPDYSRYFFTDRVFDTYHDAITWCETIASGLGFQLVVDGYDDITDTSVVCLKCNEQPKYSWFSECVFRVKVVLQDQYEVYPKYVVVASRSTGYHNHVIPVSDARAIAAAAADARAYAVGAAANAANSRAEVVDVAVHADVIARANARAVVAAAANARAAAANARVAAADAIADEETSNDYDSLYGDMLAAHFFATGYNDDGDDLHSIHFADVDTAPLPSSDSDN